jgi:hypothetical protein
LNSDVNLLEEAVTLRNMTGLATDKESFTLCKTVHAGDFCQDIVACAST